MPISTHTVSQLVGLNMNLGKTKVKIKSHGESSTVIVDEKAIG